MQQVERLAGGQLGVDVEQGDLADDLPDCRANAVHEPTSPPPPMMLTFIVISVVES